MEEEAIRSEIRKLVQKRMRPTKGRPKARQQNLKNYTPEGRRKDKGLLEAQRSLLYYAAQHQGIYDTLKEILEEDDFTEGIYWRTFGDIGDLWQNAGHVFPADLVSRFEDAKEQKQVTEIFAVQLPTENGADMEKAINEQVAVETDENDHLTANAATVEEIQRLVGCQEKTGFPVYYHLIWLDYRNREKGRIMLKSVEETTLLTKLEELQLAKRKRMYWNIRRSWIIWRIWI